MDQIQNYRFVFLFTSGFTANCSTLFRQSSSLIVKSEANVQTASYVKCNSSKVCTNSNTCWYLVVQPILQHSALFAVLSLHEWYYKNDNRALRT